MMRIQGDVLSLHGIVQRSDPALVEARRVLPAVAATAAVFVTLVIGLADQQLNNENPRIHDVRGAVEATVERAGPGDVLGKLVRRCVPGARAASVGTPAEAAALAADLGVRAR